MNWIAVEHGKSQMRAWLIRDGKASAPAIGENTGSAAQDLSEHALIQLIGDWLGPRPTLVLISGKTKTPERPVPTAPIDLTPVKMPTTDARVLAYGLPGLSQSTPPDLMYSDATRIAGFLTLNQGWDGVVCQPGPHTSWALISAGEVVSFQSFLTADMANLLTRQFSLEDITHQTDWTTQTYARALDDVLARPERLATALNVLRIGDPVQDLPKAEAQARLWGALVGAELAAARPYWLGQQLAVIAPKALSAPYLQAFRHQGVPVTIADAERMTLAGLTAARKRMA